MLGANDTVKVSLHQLLDDLGKTDDKNDDPSRYVERTVDLCKRLEGRRLDDIQDGYNLKAIKQGPVWDALESLTFSFTHVSEKNLRSLSSLSVRKQKRVWSKGKTFLMATCRPLGLWRAAATVPYAPSPIAWRS